MRIGAGLRVVMEAGTDDKRRENLRHPLHRSRCAGDHAGGDADCGGEEAGGLVESGIAGGNMLNNFVPTVFGQDEVLPPAQPPDPPSTRPSFNLESMAIQVMRIQQFLARERARKDGDSSGK